ncbi:MAG: hypothetical protein RI925_1310, partial [Pseudomonadota bacterium]
DALPICGETLRLLARLAGAAPQDAWARWQTPSDGDAQ